MTEEAVRPEVQFEPLVSLCTRRGFVFRHVRDAEVHGGHLVLREMPDDGLQLVVRQIGTEFLIPAHAADFLAREQLHMGPGRGGHLDGFEQRELLERPALDGDRESGGRQRRRGNRSAIRAEREQCGCGRNHGEERTAFHRSSGRP